MCAFCQLEVVSLVENNKVNEYYETKSIYFKL